MAGLGLTPALTCLAVSLGRNIMTAPLEGYTVKVIPGYSFVCNLETICRVYQYRRCHLSVLEQRTIEPRHMDTEKAAEMAANLALVKDAGRATMSAVVSGFQSGLSPYGVCDTVEGAMDYVKAALPRSLNSHYTEAPPNPLGGAPGLFVSGLKLFKPLVSKVDPTLTVLSIAGLTSVNVAGMQDAQQQIEIAKLPDYLVLTLSQFAYDRKAGRRVKICTAVDCPKALDLVPRKHWVWPSARLGTQRQATETDEGSSARGVADGALL